MIQKNSRKLLIGISFLLCIIAAASLAFGIRYIDRKLLISNQKAAVDLAELVNNNFFITDAEVTHMKSLTFNEMEQDPVNLRLMEVGRGAHLNANITNVYIIAALTESEVRYTTDESNADFFRCAPGTPLKGIWLLNGNISEDGDFVMASRDDIYRYTDLTEEMEKGLEEKKSFGAFSSDEWGEFITGYVPVYSTEGNFVGMLGIDMDPDQYQSSVHGMVFILVVVSMIVVVLLLILFLFFCYKYARVQEAKLYFDFYSRMNHDLQTPLIGILGLAQLAEQEEDPNKLKRYFVKVEESGEYLLHLIHDTLDIRKISSGEMKLQLQTVRYEEVLGNIADMIRINAKKKQVDFELVTQGLEPDCLVEMDPMRFQQVFLNLLSNAVKYTKTGGAVHFTVESTGKDENLLHCKYSIWDNGIGMGSDFVKNGLYQPFSQENRERDGQEGGAGLGMAIAKNLIALMGGKISVWSKPGSGTTFTVKLDLRLVDDLEKKGGAATDEEDAERKMAENEELE